MPQWDTQPLSYSLVGRALQPSWPVPQCCHPTGRHTASPASCHPPVSKSDYGSPNTLAILKNQVNTGSRTCGHPGHRWSGLGTGKPAPPYHRRNRLTYWAANCNQCLHTVERRLSPPSTGGPGRHPPHLDSQSPRVQVQLWLSKYISNPQKPGGHWLAHVWPPGSSMVWSGDWQTSPTTPPKESSDLMGG